MLTYLARVSTYTRLAWNSLRDGGRTWTIDPSLPCQGNTELMGTLHYAKYMLVLGTVHARKHSTDWTFFIPTPTPTPPRRTSVANNRKSKPKPLQTSHSLQIPLDEISGGKEDSRPVWIGTLSVICTPLRCYFPGWLGYSLQSLALISSPANSFAEEAPTSLRCTSGSLFPAIPAIS